MFKFLWQRDKEMQSLAEIITVDMEKLNLSKLAIEKAVMMIAKAIAKSDILIQTESKEKNKQEYRLNIQPNDHECGTVFWTEVVRQLLTVQEVLIIPLGGKYYLASAWKVKHVCIIDGEQHEIYNVAHVTTKDGFRETELTLKTPAHDREVIDDTERTE